MRGVFLVVAHFVIGALILAGVILWLSRESPPTKEPTSYQTILTSLDATRVAAEAALKAASSPVIVRQEVVKEVRVEPKLEYRCVVGPVSVLTESGYSVWLGEVVICGYNLSATDILGPTAQAHVEGGSIVSLQTIGLDADVLCATSKARRD